VTARHAFLPQFKEAARDPVRESRHSVSRASIVRQFIRAQLTSLGQVTLKSLVAFLASHSSGTERAPAVGCLVLQLATIWYFYCERFEFYF
jgi:hypothetical protein